MLITSALERGDHYALFHCELRIIPRLQYEFDECHI